MKERQKLSLDYAIKQILNINKENSIIQSIWLFGSCVRCEEKYSSDVDLLCIVNKTGDKERRVMRKMRSLSINPDINYPEVDLVFKYNNGNKNYIPWLDKDQNNDTFSKQLRKDAIKIWEQEN